MLLNNAHNNLSMASHADNLLEYYHNKAVRKVVYKYIKGTSCIAKEGVMKIWSPTMREVVWH